MLKSSIHQQNGYNFYFKKVEIFGHFFFRPTDNFTDDMELYVVNDTDYVFSLVNSTFGDR